MKEKKISDLLSRYEHLLVSGKNTYFDADEYDELAEYYDKLDDIETAKKIVNLGLKIHPNNESLMLRYARFLIYDANYTAALQFLNTHFSTYDFELYLLKIESLLQLGLYAEAHQLTAEVLNDDETDTEVILSELGFLYIEAEYFNEAILYFEKSLEHDPENIEVLNDLIYAYENIGDFASAIEICEKILDIDPYMLEGWLMLGKLHSLENNYEKAIDAFDFALTLDDSNVNVLKLKAHCLILSDSFDEAIELLKQCIEMLPDDEISYVTLIDCYMNMEQYDNMFASVLEYESKFGESQESIIKKAYAFFFKGDLEQSEELISKALHSGQESYTLNAVAGDLYFRMEKYSEAEAFYKKALELAEDGDRDDIIEKLVTFYIKGNDFTNAITYQKLLLETSDSAISHEKLALLYLETGDKENFRLCVNSFSDETLLSFFNIFYPEEQIDLSVVGRDYISKRIDDVYESRLLYKNIKY